MWTRTSEKGANDNYRESPEFYGEADQEVKEMPSANPQKDVVFYEEGDEGFHVTPNSKV